MSVESFWDVVALTAIRALRQAQLEVEGVTEQQPGWQAAAADRRAKMPDLLTLLHR